MLDCCPPFRLRSSTRNGGGRAFRTTNNSSYIYSLSRSVIQLGSARSARRNINTNTHEHKLGFCQPAIIIISCLVLSTHHLLLLVLLRHMHSFPIVEYYSGRQAISYVLSTTEQKTPKPSNERTKDFCGIRNANRRDSVFCSCTASQLSTFTIISPSWWLVNEIAKASFAICNVCWCW